MAKQSALDLVAGGTPFSRRRATTPSPGCSASRAPLVELHADRTRALPVNDPLDRELTISCGCALMNLIVAARHFGRFRDADPARTDAPGPHRARAPVRGRRRGAAGQRPVRRDPARRTYRKRFAARKVPRRRSGRGRRRPQAGGAWLEVIAGAHARREVAALIAEADRMQWADPSWRRELAQWMHPRRSGDGLVIAGLTSPLTHAVVRTFDWGTASPPGPRTGGRSPVLAVLGTERDRPRDWIAAGEALQAVLLTAQTHRLQASFLNQAIQVAASARPAAKPARPRRAAPTGDPARHPAEKRRPRRAGRSRTSSRPVNRLWRCTIPISL